MKLKRVSRRSLIVSSGLSLCNPTTNEVEVIKNGLTFDNPAYRNAIRYSRYDRVSIPPSLMYYSRGKYNDEPCINVPIGFDFAGIVKEYSNLNIIDKRVYTKVDHAPFVLTLRDDQKEAADTYLIKNEKTPPISALIQLPTGKGKTILGLYLASRLSCKTLIVVHKDDLIKGWKSDISLAFDNKVNAGLIKAKSRVVGHFITLATVQTLSRMSDKELEVLYSTFGFVIQDECHHCPASSYDVVAKFRPRYRLGLTATPERSDGLDHIMNLYYGSMCYKYHESGDKEETDILPVKVIRRKSSIYFDPLFQRFKTPQRSLYKLVDLYAPQDLKLSNDQIRLSEIPYKERPTLSYQNVDTFVVKNEQYKEMVLKDVISEYEQGHSCLLFFTQKEGVDNYFDSLADIVGIDNVTKFYGNCKTNDLSLTIAEEKKKHITLATYAKGTEGTNVKQWEVLFLVSSLNNEKNTEQAVGRIRRVKEGKINPVLVYDYRVPYVYSLSNHGVSRDRRYKKLGFDLGESQKNKRSIFSRGY